MGHSEEPKQRSRNATVPTLRPKIPSSTRSSTILRMAFGLPTSQPMWSRRPRRRWGRHADRRAVLSSSFPNSRAVKRLGIFKNNNNHLGPVNLNRQYLVEFGPYGPSMLGFARGLGHARYPLVPVNAE